MLVNMEGGEERATNAFTIKAWLLLSFKNFSWMGPTERGGERAAGNRK